MRNPLFSDGQFEQMALEVCQLLFDVGYQVEHPAVRDMAVGAGCRQSSAGRILFDASQVDELASRLRRQYPRPARDAQPPTWVRPRRQLSVGFGNLTPKFFDYARDRAVAGSTVLFCDLVRFAHTEPRVGSLTIPLSRQDAPPAVEQLESVWMMALLTDKRIGSVDATVPEAVPFLAEMGETLGNDPADFVGCCNCINPPLRLEGRTAETMIRRSRYHSTSMITSMPCLGGTSPVDVYGAIVLAVAEIVGGLILSTIIDPEAPLLGYIASVQLDMRTGNPTSSSPQTVQVDAGVRQLMEHSFGGGTRVGGRSYISARRPGLQALLERFLKALGYAVLLDEGGLALAGNGNLDNGSMVSPEQFLLDLEAIEGLNWLWAAPVVPPPDDAATRIAEAISEAGGNFLTCDHTLTHYRDEMWDPAYVQRLVGTRTEKEILDCCHAEYRAKLAAYTPASYPPEQLRELERILQAGRARLVG